MKDRRVALVLIPVLLLALLVRGLGGRDAEPRSTYTESPPLLDLIRVETPSAQQETQGVVVSEYERLASVPAQSATVFQVESTPEAYSVQLRGAEAPYTQTVPGGLITLSRAESGAVLWRVTDGPYQGALILKTERANGKADVRVDSAEYVRQRLPEQVRWLNAPGID